jgi:Concanavalin A-like lectin/glucanases superfamily/SPRY domain
MIGTISSLKGSAGYKIPNSLRFRSSASAWLGQAFAANSSSTAWTYSGWVKRGQLGIVAGLLGGSVTNSNQCEIWFNSADQLVASWYNGSYQFNLTTTQVFRDTSAWYHVVVAFDSTAATSTNRVKIYVNGVQITAFGTATYPALNSTPPIYTSVTTHIGRYYDGTNYYFDGYMAEVNFIDGQALAPSSFGAISPQTGVWAPKAYTGTYGTNGFYLKFTDNSAATSAAIGKDYSGNYNNWTPTNISMTAGVTFDSMIDTPTPYADGGNGRGNYAVLNVVDRAGSATVTNGNLSYATSTATNDPIRATIAVSSGKWYWEVLATNYSGTFASTYDIGILDASMSFSSNTSIGYYANGYSYYGAAGTKGNNSNYVAYGSSYTIGDVIGVALNLDAGTITFYKNNVSQGVAFTGLSGSFVPAISDVSGVSNITVEANFGQRPFAYTPPTGFKALNTYNLPAPAIKKPAAFMAATTYTGTGSALTISNTTNNSSFQPDFVWIKGRSGATDHALYDSVRGATKDLVSNSTAAETTQATGLTTFNSDGFTIGSLAKVNTNAATYVAWQWDAGSSTVTNTDGTITSQVRANPTAGVSVVTYTGNGTGGATVGHGLGAVPAMVITKSRSSSSVNSIWRTKHKSLNSNNNVTLNVTDAQSNVVTSSQSGGIGDLSSSSTFSLVNGTVDCKNVNENTTTYVAYCFAEITDYSKFGSYTGNGSADGGFIYTGFRPKFIMIKRTDVAGNWIIEDANRSSYNQTSAALYPNISNAEDTSYTLNVLSNGIKIRDTAAGINASSGTYIFAAFAEAPFKNALAR